MVVREKKWQMVVVICVLGVIGGISLLAWQNVRSFKPGITSRKQETLMVTARAEAQYLQEILKKTIAIMEVAVLYPPLQERAKP